MCVCKCREWGGQGLLRDIYSNVLVMSLAYVIIAGAFCEWAWVARSNVAVSLVASHFSAVVAVAYTQPSIVMYLTVICLYLFNVDACKHLFLSTYIVGSVLHDATAGDEQCSEAYYVLHNIEAASVVVRADGYCLQRLPAVADVHPNMD